MSIYYRPLGYERVYLPLCKVADTPFHIQGDVIPSLYWFVKFTPFFHQRTWLNEQRMLHYYMLILNTFYCLIRLEGLLTTLLSPSISCTSSGFQDVRLRDTLVCSPLIPRLQNLEAACDFLGDLMAHAHLVALSLHNRSNTGYNKVMGL